MTTPDDKPRFRERLSRGLARFRPRMTEPDRATTPEERRFAFQILFFSLVCLGSGQSIMFAILPPVSRELGISEFQVGLIFAVSATIWIFSSPYWGRRSDEVGRRPMMLMGLYAFAISTLLFAGVMWLDLHGLLATAIAYPLMVAARSIYGIFGSGTYPAAQAYIVDRTQREERVNAIAMLTAAFGLGVAVGPGIGALFARFDLLMPFVAVSVIALLSALAIYFYLPERTAPAERVLPPPMSWRDPRLLPFLVFGTVLNTVGAIPIQTFAFLLMDQLGYDSAAAAEFAGVGLMISSLASLFAQFVLVQRFRLTSRTLIRWGVGVAILSNVIFAVGDSYALLALAMVLSGLGFGMARPGLAAAASLGVRLDEQGAAAGLMGATGGAGFIFAPIVGNWLYALSPPAPYVLGVALLVGLIAYALINPRMRAMSDDVPEDPDSGVPKS